MRIGGVPGLGASLVLAGVTLAVFATFQNYGPESAVRRFHHAIANHDRAELEQVVEGGADSSAVRELGSAVSGALAASGANYQIVTSERTPTQVVMLARYRGHDSIVWIVTKARDRWRIDPYLTLQGLRRLGYG